METLPPRENASAEDVVLATKHDVTAAAHASNADPRLAKDAWIEAVQSGKVNSALERVARLFLLNVGKPIPTSTLREVGGMHGDRRARDLVASPRWEIDREIGDGGMVYFTLVRSPVDAPPTGQLQMVLDAPSNPTGNAPVDAPLPHLSRPVEDLDTADLPRIVSAVVDGEVARALDRLSGAHGGSRTAALTAAILAAAGELDG